VEEADIPLEQLHEEIHHRAEHEGERWISWVALSTAMLAVLAAIAALLSGDRANEAMMSQIESSDQWAYYQAKGIKAAVLGTRISREEDANDKAEVARYAKEQSEIEKEARQKQAEARRDFHQHETFARAVTMFQIAIAVAAISALTKRRRYWVASIAMGAAGGVFLVLGFIAH
jgi:Domain of unknown function (DUF4337)